VFTTIATLNTNFRQQPFDEACAALNLTV